MIYTEQWIREALEEMGEACAVQLTRRRWAELPKGSRWLANVLPVGVLLDSLVLCGTLESGYGMAPTVDQFLARRGLRVTYYWLAQRPMYPDGTL